MATTSWRDQQEFELKEKELPTAFRIPARRASIDVVLCVASPSRREGQSLSDGEGESQITVCSEQESG